MYRNTVSVCAQDRRTWLYLLVWTLEIGQNYTLGVFHFTKILNIISELECHVNHVFVRHYFDMSVYLVLFSNTTFVYSYSFKRRRVDNSPTCGNFLL